MSDRKDELRARLEEELRASSEQVMQAQAEREERLAAARAHKQEVEANVDQIREERRARRVE